MQVTLLLLFVLLTDANLIFHGPSQLEGIDLPSYHFMFIGKQHLLNITYTRLVAAKPWDLCSKASNSGDLEGNLVLTTRDACSPVVKFRNAEKAKAQGIVLMDDPLQFFDLSASLFRSGGIELSGVEIQATSNKQFNDIKKYSSNNNYYVNVSLFSGMKKNFNFTNLPEYVRPAEPVMTPFSVVIGIWSIINIVLSTWKLSQFVQAQGRLKLKLPEVCLGLEWIASLERLLLCPEPDTGLGRGLYEFAYISGFQTISYPWSAISTLLMAYYWNDALQNWMPSKTSTFCLPSAHYWKIPFVVASIVLIVFDLITSVLRSIYLGSIYFRLINTLFIALITAFIAILFTYSGIRVLLFAGESQSRTKTSAIKRLSRFIVGNATGLFAIIIGLIIVGVGSETNYVYYYGIFLTVAGVSTVSTLQILVFQPDAQNKSSNSTVEMTKVPSTTSTHASATTEV